MASDRGATLLGDCLSVHFVSTTPTFGLSITMTTPATQPLKSALSVRQHLYTLQFKNGQVHKHQDLLALRQFRSDGRLGAVVSEQPPV